MFGLGYTELILVFVVVLLLFGGKKIPEVARGLGKGINEFKKAKEGLTDAITEEVKQVSEDPKPAAPKKPTKEA